MATAPAAVKLNALKHVGNFAGETDIEQWFDRMEMAMRIDGIPVGSHADVLAMHLEGPAYDTWKGLSVASKQNAAAIKAESLACSAWRRGIGL